MSCSTLEGEGVGIAAVEFSALSPFEVVGIVSAGACFAVGGGGDGTFLAVSDFAVFFVSLTALGFVSVGGSFLGFTVDSDFSTISTFLVSS